MTAAGAVPAAADFGGLPLRFGWTPSAFALACWGGWVAAACAAGCVNGDWKTALWNGCCGRVDRAGKLRGKEGGGGGVLCAVAPVNGMALCGSGPGADPEGGAAAVGMG